jgi:transcription elongation factor Elf1
MECPVCGSEDIVDGSWNQPGQHFCRSCGSLFDDAPEGVQIVEDNGDTEPITPVREDTGAVIVSNCPECGQEGVVRGEGLVCPNGHRFTMKELVQVHYARMKQREEEETA